MNVPAGSYTVTASKTNYKGGTSDRFSVHAGAPSHAWDTFMDLLNSVVTVKADAGAFSGLQSGTSITVLIDGSTRAVLTAAIPSAAVTLPVGTHTFAAAATGRTWSARSYYVEVETMTYTFTGQSQNEEARTRRREASASERNPNVAMNPTHNWNATLEQHPIVPRDSRNPSRKRSSKNVDAAWQDELRTPSEGMRLAIEDLRSATVVIDRVCRTLVAAETVFTHVDSGSSTECAVPSLPDSHPAAVLLLAGAALLATLSCGGGGATNTGPSAPATSTPVLSAVTVSLTPATVQEGQSSVATAAGADQNAAPIATGAVTWTSSSPSIASIVSNGAITAIAAGQTVITAAAGGRTGQATLTVNPAVVASVSVTPAFDTLLVGQSHTLQATPKSAVGTALTGRVIAWLSSDTTIAIVNSLGAVTARKVGSVTITATAEGKNGTVQVAIGSNVPVVTISGPTTATRTGWASTTLIALQVRDAWSRPVSQAALTWSLPAAGGWLFPSATATATDGTASASWIAGTVAGVVTATATANGGSSQAVGTYAVSVLPTTSYNAINASFAVPGGISAAGYRLDVTPLSEPTGTYYAAIQWNGGYMGIQRGGQFFDRQLQFSAWNNASGSAAVIDSASSHLRCYAFGNEGTGVACAMSYPWQVGKAYQFETQFTASSQGTLIDGWVTSVSDGTRTYVGRIRQAGALPQSSLGTFVEDFIQNAPHCVANQLRSYRVASARALLGSTWTTLATASVSPYPPTTTCANVNFGVANGGLEISLGAATPRNPTLPIPGVVPMP